jgi:C-terminal processing protease CtpA/Prc
VLICLLICSSLAYPAQKAPVNLNFEQGKIGEVPPGWFLPPVSSQGGYTAGLTDENPKSGALCVVMKSAAAAMPRGFGNLMQICDASGVRGRRVRFRAAVRAEVMGFTNQAQLWLRVDRRGQRMGFFDNMDDRPIVSSRWNYYDIIGDIDEDAETINLGLMLIGNGKVWLDDVSFEIVGEAERPVVELARPLTARGLGNLVAFTRLLGYVRHFHPSDEAARTDWEAFAIEGMRSVEKADNATELAVKLESLFHAIAPTVRVYATGQAPAIAAPSPPPNAAGSLEVVRWTHVGFGAGNMPGLYRSQRSRYDAPGGRFPDQFAGFQEPYQADLGGGVSCSVLLALFADTNGTWPRSEPVKQEPPVPRPTRANYSAKDRATRLAAVALAWNVFQHFYPYFDVIKTDWPGALTAALRSAATDQDERAFAITLRHLIAALHDGHGRVNEAGSATATFTPAIAWDWIEDQLVVTRVKDQAQGLAPGDAVVAINGRPAAQVLADTESLISGATPQWIRYRALQQLSLGNKDEPLALDVERLTSPGKQIQIALKHDAPLGTIREPRPAKIAELEPGIFYVNLDQINDSDFSGALARLADATGIVFDMRGYPGNLHDAMAFFSHLSEQPMTSAQWHVPIVSRPDRKDVQFSHSGDWQITPQAPYLKAKKAFITDGRAISYAESCMGIVEYYKLGEIVGGPTAGTNGNVNSFRLPGGYTISWTGMKVLKQDGSQHHGVGILPTVPVSRTRAGVAAGRDELLERAVQTVRK